VLLPQAESAEATTSSWNEVEFPGQFRSAMHAREYFNRVDTFLRTRLRLDATHILRRVTKSPGGEAHFAATSLLHVLETRSWIQWEMKSEEALWLALTVKIASKKAEPR
jgi:hypothetical protein